MPANYEYRGNFEDILGPGPQEMAFYAALSPIVAEFKSDPMSVQCFDGRIVQQAIALVEDYDRRYRKFFAEEAKRASQPKPQPRAPRSRMMIGE